MIIGLDLATLTGCSVWSEVGLTVQCGVIDCSIRLTETKTMKIDPPGKRFRLLEAGITQLINKYKPIGISGIFYEQAVMGPMAGGAAAKIANGMVAITELLAYKHEIPAFGVATGTLKKHATGDGGSGTKKQHMIAAAMHHSPKYHQNKKPWGFPMNDSINKSRPWHTDDNAVDAWWLGHFGLVQLGKIPKPQWAEAYALIAPNQVQVFSPTLKTPQLYIV